MHFGASAVGADGSRRDAGVVTRSLHAAQRVCASLPPSQRTWGPQQSVSVTS